MDPRNDYCTKHSLKLHPAQQKLQDNTIKTVEESMCLGAPEVLEHCSNLIQLIKGKRCLDIGTFTGASALAWALATPPDGEIITMDISDTHYKAVGVPIIKEAGVLEKIHLKLQPALKTLDELLANNEEGKFDFAFIDAEKEEYPETYQKCTELLRPGGFLAIDNALWSNRVLMGPDTFDTATAGVDKANKMALADERVNCSLLPIGDGLMLAFKK